MSEKNPSLIIELVGPAGAGKTTLLHALMKQDQKFHLGKELEVRKFENFLPFVNHIPPLVPWLSQRNGTDRRLNWNEIKSMVYLHGWPEVLKHQVNGDGSVVILDHGAVFKLATLMEFGPEWLNCPQLAPLWDDLFEKWAETLDILICLDAPDSILIDRIENRSQKHIVKGKPDEETLKFLKRSRMALQQVMDKLTSYPTTRLLQFDAHRSSTNEILADVLAACSIKQSEIIN